MFEPTSKKILLTALVACFAFQTALVYSDEPTGPIDEAAVRGRAIYHEQACQVCHQLWGQGGFLGPDLTNAASRVDSARLALLLTEGSGQMPALHLGARQIADLRAFLRSVDRPELGRGQLRQGSEGGETDAWAGVRRAAAERDPPRAAARGRDLFTARPCGTCHVPFQTSVVNAPDLTTVSQRLSREELEAVLRLGRVARGMPPPQPPLSDDEIGDLTAWFEWVGSRRAELQAAVAAERPRLRWRALPWWEF